MTRQVRLVNRTYSTAGLHELHLMAVADVDPANVHCMCFNFFLFLFRDDVADGKRRSRGEEPRLPGEGVCSTINCTRTWLDEGDADLSGRASVLP